MPGIAVYGRQEQRLGATLRPRVSIALHEVKLKGIIKSSVFAPPGEDRSTTVVSSLRAKGRSWSNATP
jgi:hypothetical protein